MALGRLGVSAVEEGGGRMEAKREAGQGWAWRKGGCAPLLWMGWVQVRDLRKIGRRASQWDVLSATK